MSKSDFTQLVTFVINIVLVDVHSIFRRTSFWMPEILRPASVVCEGPVTDNQQLANTSVFFTQMKQQQLSISQPCWRSSPLSTLSSSPFFTLLLCILDLNTCPSKQATSGHPRWRHGQQASWKSEFCLYAVKNSKFLHLSQPLLW